MEPKAIRVKIWSLEAINSYRYGQESVPIGIDLCKVNSGTSFFYLFFDAFQTLFHNLWVDSDDSLVNTWTILLTCISSHQSWELIVQTRKKHLITRGWGCIWSIWGCEAKKWRKFTPARLGIIPAPIGILSSNLGDFSWVYFFTSKYVFKLSSRFVFILTF